MEEGTAEYTWKYRNEDDRGGSVVSGELRRVSPVVTTKSAFVPFWCAKVLLGRFRCL